MHAPPTHAYPELPTGAKSDALLRSHSRAQGCGTSQTKHHENGTQNSLAISELCGPGPASGPL